MIGDKPYKDSRDITDIAFIYEYNEFKNSKCFCKVREFACELGFTIQW